MHNQLECTITWFLRPSPMTLKVTFLDIYHCEIQTYTLSYHLYNTSLLLSIEYITNLVSCLGALAQATFKGINLRGNIWCVRTKSSFAQSPYKKKLSSLCALHLNSTCNSSSIEPFLHIGTNVSVDFNPIFYLTQHLLLAHWILIAPSGTVLPWLGFVVTNLFFSNCRSKNACENYLGL